MRDAMRTREICMMTEVARLKLKADATDKDFASSPFIQNRPLGACSLADLLRYTRLVGNKNFALVFILGLMSGLLSRTLPQFGLGPACSWCLLGYTSFSFHRIHIFILTLGASRFSSGVTAACMTTMNKRISCRWSWTCYWNTERWPQIDSLGYPDVISGPVVVYCDAYLPEMSFVHKPAP